MKNFRELFKENDFILKFHQPVKIIAELKYMVFLLLVRFIEIIILIIKLNNLLLIFYCYFDTSYNKRVKSYFWIIYYFIFFFESEKIYINLKNSISSFLNMRQIYRNSFFTLLGFKVINHFRNLFL